jgi:hypothetical protein
VVGAYPYRENAPCGIFVGKPMLVLLGAIVNPRDRPQLAAVIDRAQSLSSTSPLQEAMNTT